MNRKVSSSILPVRFLTLALALCCLTTGCSQELARTLSELTRLQAAIAKEFGEPNVNVSNNGSSLVVTFINSPLNSQATEERAKRAGQTAAFVSQHYPAVAGLEDIWVGFAKTETRFIFMHFTQSLDFFRFDNRGQPLTFDKRAPGEFDTRARPSAVYSAKLDQTEVAIPLLQLEGDSSNGFALSPHFSVPGDVTGVRKATASPRSVNFDFSSYSEKSMFPGAPEISFLADGKTIFETTDQFSTSKSFEGQFSEFLLLEVPFPVFRRLTAARKVRLRIGDREYELTEEQLKALRAMNDYVRA